MLSLPNFDSRTPSQSLILSETNDKPNELAGDKLVSAMRGNGWTMVHLPYGGTVEVDLKRALPFGQPWRAWWVDTKCGAKSVFARGNVEDGSKVFTAPTGGSKEDDWLLLLETGSSIA